jgi:hypothetical protein
MVVEFTTTCVIVAYHHYWMLELFRQCAIYLQVWKNVKVYFKWGWNKSPFDINSVVFHFDDINYGRRSQPYFFLTIATQLFLFITLRNINCKPHWLAICCLSRVFFFFLDIWILSVNHANNNLCTWQNVFSMHYIHKLVIHHLSIGGWFKLSFHINQWKALVCWKYVFCWGSLDGICISCEVPSIADTTLGISEQTYARDRTYFQCTTYTNLWSIICPLEVDLREWNW